MLAYIFSSRTFVTVSTPVMNASMMKRSQLIVEWRPLKPDLTLVNLFFRAITENEISTQTARSVAGMKTCIANACEKVNREKNLLLALAFEWAVSAVTPSLYIFINDSYYWWIKNKFSIPHFTCLPTVSLLLKKKGINLFFQRVKVKMCKAYFFLNPLYIYHTSQWTHFSISLKLIQFCCYNIKLPSS